MLPGGGKRGGAHCTVAVAKEQESISIALGNSSGDGEMLSLPSRSASALPAAWSTNQCQTNIDYHSGNIFMGRF